jgi:hypothetical protein
MVNALVVGEVIVRVQVLAVPLAALAYGLPGLDAVRIDLSTPFRTVGLTVR